MGTKLKTLFSINTLSLLSLFCLLLVHYKISFTENGTKKLQKFYFFKPVADTLLKIGIDTELVFLLINDNNTFFNEKYIKLNVLPSSKFTIQKKEINISTLRRLLLFISSNYNLLLDVEKKFNVPKEVITAILWTETQFGNILGTHHIPSVFLSIAIAPYIFWQNSFQFSAKKQTDLTFYNEADSITNKIFERIKEKSERAIIELSALLDMKKVGIEIQSLYGSYAGAFGIPQFLPSSYINFGYDGDRNGKVDLFSLPDAIFSVANFLKKNGWENHSIEKKKSALFAYNRSQSYVNYILELSSRIKNKKSYNK